MVAAVFSIIMFSGIILAVVGGVLFNVPLTIIALGILGMPFILLACRMILPIKPIKKFCCAIGWHSPSSLWDTWKNPNDPLQFLDYAKCPWCKYEGQIDSSGSLF